MRRAAVPADQTPSPAGSADHHSSDVVFMTSILDPLVAHLVGKGRLAARRQRHRRHKLPLLVRGDGACLTRQWVDLVVGGTWHSMVGMVT